MNLRVWKNSLSFIALFFIMSPNHVLADNGAASTCGILCGSWMLMVITVIVLNIALLIWVAKDAKSRGMGSAMGWIFLVLFLGVIGLVIYLFSRPSGDLVTCEHCNNKKLRVARLCPHCGHPSDPFGTAPQLASRQNNVNVEINMKKEVSEPSVTEKYSFCTNCGNRLQNEDIFCPECGTKKA